MNIMLRADITRDEWEAIRVLAIKTKTPTATLVGNALRRDRVTKQAFETKEQTK